MTKPESNFELSDRIPPEEHADLDSTPQAHAPVQTLLQILKAHSRRIWIDSMKTYDGYESVSNTFPPPKVDPPTSTNVALRRSIDSV